MLKAKLQTDQIQALKSGNSKDLEMIRYILSQIKNKEIEKREDLTEEEEIQVLKKVAKNLRKAIDMFEKGGRGDLVETNKYQLEVVTRYLPPANEEV